MPCHVDDIPANAAKKEIDKVVFLDDGRISIKEVGDSFHGKYPTVSELVVKYRKKRKTFSYKVSGTMMVIVAPCPKKC